MHSDLHLHALAEPVCIWHCTGLSVCIIAIILYLHNSIACCLWIADHLCLWVYVSQCQVLSKSKFQPCSYIWTSCMSICIAVGAIVYQSFASLSAHIVARIRFSQPQYTVREGPQICLDVINELYDPTSPPTERIIITANIGKYGRWLILYSQFKKLLIQT